MISITKLFEFEAAHFLPHYLGPCGNVHGHGYKLEVEVTSMYPIEGDKFKMVWDFSTLKDIVQDIIIKKFDHQVINALPEGEFTKWLPMPTAEAMVAFFRERLQDALTEHKYIILLRVRLWETSTSYAEWKSDG